MRALTLAIAAALLAPLSLAAAPVVVSLSYDDALPSQLDVALPALDAHGFRATFFLSLAAPAVASRLADWRAAAARGHELGNHTLFHPCRKTPERDWLAPHRDLDRISVAALREEVLAANAHLQAIDGRSQRTFAAPCGEREAAGQPYLPALKPLFAALRVRSDGGAGPGDDLADLAAVDAAGLDAPALIATVERAARRGSPVLLTFHGVGGDYLSVSASAHAALLAHLAARPDRFRVLTLLEFARSHPH